MVKDKQVDEVSETRRDAQCEDDGIIAVGQDSAADDSDHADLSGYKRRSLKGKPRIPTAVDTSRLNKHLTNIWSSKRKKPAKKHLSSVPLDSSQAYTSDVLNEAQVELSDHVGASGAAEKSRAINSQASTVIIVKTLPQKEAASYYSSAKVQKVSEDVDKSEVQKGSRDIAERLKARKQRYTASLGSSTSSIDASVNDSGQVTCELCAETVVDYVQLVCHVCQQHEDCTYVRNYLDEIQPIADALSAMSMACKACGRTFAGHAALAAHAHECSAVSKAGRVSKLGAQRRRVTASLLSPSEHAGDHTVQSRQNGAKPSLKSGPVKDDRQHCKCEHCKRTFTSQANLANHVAHVHNQKHLKSAGRRGRRSAAVTPSLAGSKIQQQANSAQSSVSASTSSSQFQRCDHCSACFSRTSLLVTHMRYCLKADSNIQ